MGSGSFQVDLICCDGINQDPVRFDVSISVSSPIELERVVFVLRRQKLTCEQKLDQDFELIQIFFLAFEAASCLDEIGKNSSGNASDAQLTKEFGGVLELMDFRAFRSLAHGLAG